MLTDIELFHSEFNIYKSGRCYSLAFAKNLQMLSYSIDMVKNKTKTITSFLTNSVFYIIKKR